MSGGSAEPRRLSLGEILGGWRFPVLSLALLAGLTAGLLAVLVVPPPAGHLGALAEDFRVWCFGYDPATGSYQWMWVAMAFVKPLILAVGLIVVWWGPLVEVLRTPRRVAPWALAGLGLAGLALAGIGFFEPTEDTAELPFPAEDLRIAHRPPAIDLVDQDGAPVSLDALRGQVVVVTATYAHCAHTCPLIVSQARAALAELSESERAEVTVLSVTLDPERDTPEVLAKLARAHGLGAPTWRFATGEPAAVEEILDRLDVARRRVPETGVIEHANLFLVVDRAGHIAYRFTLGERQQRWLVSALRLLLAEDTPLQG